MEEVWKSFSQGRVKAGAHVVVAVQHSEQSVVALHKACAVTDSHTLCGITGEALFTLEKSALLCGSGALYGTLSQQECHREERLQNGIEFIS